MTTDEILAGLQKQRAAARSRWEAQILSATIERIEADDRELAKADRRTAEQEQIIAGRGEVIEKLRESLTEALDEWDSWHIDQRDSIPHPRSTELRKLTEAP